MTALLFVGVFGSIAYRHSDFSNTVVKGVLTACSLAGVVGCQYFTWMESRANGSRAVRIANAAFFAFIVVLVGWAIIDKIAGL